jgi:hypothetical protein
MTDLAITLRSRLRQVPVVSTVSRSFRKRAEPGLRWMNAHFGSRTGRHFTQPTRYFVRNRVAGYIGWVGNGNSGDEAIFMAFRRLFPRFQALLYDRPPFEMLLHRRFVSGEPFYDFVTLGGGTLFSVRCCYYQFANALRQGAPVWTFGTGLDDPELLERQGGRPWGVRLRDHLALLRDFAGLLKDASLVTVRGPRTARVLQEQGFSGARVIGDPALGACEPMPLPGGKRAAINLAMWKDRGGREAEQSVSALRSAVRYLLDKGWHVDYVPTARGDGSIGKMLVREAFPGRVRVLPNIASPSRLIERLRGYDLLIGERLHSLVLSAGSGVPVIGLEYSPKCRDFMESVGMEHFCLNASTLTADTLIGAIDEADSSRQSINRTLNDRCSAYRRLQRDAAAHMAKLVSPVAIAT